MAHSRHDQSNSESKQEHGIPDLEERDSGFGNTPLLAALAEANRNKTELYLKHASKKALDMADTTPYCKNTPLILAIKLGWEDIALEIISKGADVNACASDGLNALDYACMLRLNAVIKALLEKGMNPDRVNLQNSTAKDYYFYEYSPLDTMMCHRMIGSVAKTTPLIDLHHIYDFRGCIGDNSDYLSSSSRKFSSDTARLLGGESRCRQVFLARLNRIRSSVLSQELDTIRQSQNNDLNRELSEKFDFIFSQRLQAYPYPIDKDAKDQIFLDAKRICIANYLKHHNEEKVDNDARSSSKDFTFEDFKKSYLDGYKKTWFKNPWSTMKKLLEGDEIHYLHEVYDYCRNHPTSRAKNIITELESKVLTQALSESPALTTAMAIQSPMAKLDFFTKNRESRVGHVGSAIAILDEHKHPTKFL